MFSILAVLFLSSSGGDDATVQKTTGCQTTEQNSEIVLAQSNCVTGYCGSQWGCWVTCEHWK